MFYLGNRSLPRIFFYLLRFQNSSNQAVYRNLLLTFEDGSNIILQLCLHISNSQKSTLKPKYLHLITWLSGKPFRCVLLDQIHLLKYRYKTFAVQGFGANSSTMADDKLEWVFDSLVEFLRGPIWNIPVLTFIEQKSVGKFLNIYLLIYIYFIYEYRKNNYGYLPSQVPGGDTEWKTRKILN